MTDIFVTKTQDKRKLLEVLQATEMPYRATIKKGGTRSIQQNRYLWGVCYPTILEKGDLEGWRGEDLHEYFLGEHFGWETIAGFGKKRVKPIHRSHNLSTMEFADYVAFVQERAAGLGIYIPDPEET